MADGMLTELYMRAFQVKAEVEHYSGASGEVNDRRRQVALAKSNLLNELIDFRTNQLIMGKCEDGGDAL